MRGARRTARHLCAALLACNCTGLWYVRLASAAEGPNVAAAADSAGDRQLSRQRFREASALAQAERWSEALALYRSANELFSHPTTLLNIGYCYEKLADPASAIRYTAAGVAAAEGERGEGEPVAEARLDQARSALRELRSQVAELQLVPELTYALLSVDAAGVAVTAYDGELLLFADPDQRVTPATITSKATLLLNPGRRSLRVRGSGGDTTHELLLAPGQRLNLDPTDATKQSLPAATERQIETSRPVGQRLTARPETPREQPLRRASSAAASSSAPSTRQQWGVATLILGATATSIGLGSGILAWSTKRQLDQHCDGDANCPASEAGAISRFRTAAAVSTVSVAVGLLASGTGVTLLLLEAREPSAPRLSVSVSPAGAVRVNGSF